MKYTIQHKIIVLIALVGSFLFVSCDGCSPTGRQALQHRRTSSSKHQPMSEKRRPNKNNNITHSSSIVHMQKRGGVYYIPVRLNDVDMDIIFDTGASDIVISSVEALFLIRQGKLTEDDILGQAYYGIADGNIAVGTVINLRKVEIGNCVLNNVQATVVDNIDAPLLLGQSALAQFGRVSIDYNNNTIEFN